MSRSPLLQPQSTERNDDSSNEGVGHFSEWSRQTKKEFLEALSSNSAHDWVIVIGNEGGDLDSMASALAWAYHLMHLPTPQKAVALLQTVADALDLRPDNKLALVYARMASGHRDLLTIDELPIKPFDLWHRIQGIALVDHNVPQSYWGNTTIVSIIDHHDDQGLAPGVSTRIIGQSASCSSLVTETILDEIESWSTSTSSPRKQHEEEGYFLHGPLPIELIEILLRTIALDSGGLKKKDRFDVDVRSARRLHGKSSWRSRKLKEVMKTLSRDMSYAKTSLGELTLRDLLRRDWKGDSVPTLSHKYPTLALGFASIPLSLNDQILRLPEQTPPEWFAVERAWTSESNTDVSVVLTSFKDPLADKKVHEIALVVAHGLSKRLHEKAADRLFHTLKRAIEEAPELAGLEKWTRPDKKKLLPRRAVWVYSEDGWGGRKLIRPIVEKAAREWEG
ncbi:hypothetical protein T439DRAFT_288358 [Meredithblackwellia eburnea MCA 4105]